MTQLIIEMMILTGIVGGILALIVGTIGAIYQAIKNKKNEVQ